MAPRKIALLTDSCADLSQQLAEENRIHIVPLHTGAVPAAVAAEAALAAVDVHAVQKELGHGMARLLRAPGELPHQGGGVALTPGAAVEYHNVLAHRNILLFRGIDFPRARYYNHSRHEKENKYAQSSAILVRENNTYL